MINKTISLIQNNYVKFFKFCCVGGVSTIVNYAIFYLLYTKLSLYYLLSSAIGFVIGVCVGYILNSYFTFQSNGSAVKYFSVYGVTLLLSLIILKIQVEKLNINPLLANAITIGLVVFINFFGVKFYAFKSPAACPKS